LLSLIKRNLNDKVEQRQAASKLYRDGSNPVPRSYDMYQPVKVRNVRGDNVKRIPGTIVQIKGPSTYIVRTLGNKRRYVHADHLVHDDVRRELNDDVIVNQKDESLPVLPQVNVPVEENVKSPTDSVPSIVSQENDKCTKAVECKTPQNAMPVLRRSNREVKAPQRLISTM
jgi:hypothetical protein